LALAAWRFLAANSFKLKVRVSELDLDVFLEECDRAILKIPN
jgi:hypothetical protein